MAKQKKPAKKKAVAKKPTKANLTKKPAKKAKTQPKAQAKNSVRPSTLHKMTIVCGKHKDCLAFAKAVVAEAKKIPGRAGHKVRDLADSFIPG